AVDALVVASGEVTGTGALHLDDPGAQVRELAGAERRRDGVFQADYGDAVQGTDVVRLHVHFRFLLLPAEKLPVGPGSSRPTAVGQALCGKPDSAGRHEDGPTGPAIPAPDI